MKLVSFDVGGRVVTINPAMVTRVYRSSKYVRVKNSEPPKEVLCTEVYVRSSSDDGDAVVEIDLPYKEVVAALNKGLLS